jgi:energy-coupling factor transporter ATP-binding protein EcfA2
MARAVALGPDLLLDEPAAGTNDVESLRLADSIRHVRDVEKCAILLIDHDLPFVMNLCERLYVLDAGRVIAEGGPLGVQANPRVKQAHLGARGSGGVRSSGVAPFPTGGRRSGSRRSRGNPSQNRIGADESLIPRRRTTGSFWGAAMAPHML